MPDHDPLTLKLSLREKLAYGAGDIGSNLMLSYWHIIFAQVLHR